MFAKLFRRVAMYRMRWFANRGRAVRRWRRARLSFFRLEDRVTPAGTIDVTLFGNAFSENFDSLPIMGGAQEFSTLPIGWHANEMGENANTAYSTGTGSSTTGDTYNFGATSGTDRALGGLQSGTLIPTIGAAFVNNTGGTIGSVGVGYDGEQWRLGATGRVDRLDFQYSLDASSLTTGTWIDFDALDFTAPVTTGTVGALNGNAAANRTNVNSVVSGLSIPNGSTFWVRWTDFNASGADDGLAIDAFNITAHPVTASLSATFDGSNNLVITDADGSKANDWTISQSGANIVITDANESFASAPAGGTLSNGNKTLTIGAGAFSGKIIVNGAGGADTLNLSYHSANPFAKAIDFHGGNPTTDPGDRIVMNGTGTFDAVAHVLANASDGSIAVTGNGTVTYTGLEPVDDLLVADHRTFTFNGASEMITLTDAAGAQMTIDSDFGESVTFANPSSSLTIDAAGGNDTITIVSVDADGPFNASLIINGGTGSDTVNLNADIMFAASKFLDVNLQDDDATPGTDTVNIGANANLILSGTGWATIEASRNIAMASGSSIVTVDGDITMKANRQATPTGGNFAGIRMDGGTIQSTTGAILLEGRGGDDSVGDQFGVDLFGGGDIGVGTSGLVTVRGFGGNSTGTQNIGVRMSNAGAQITSGGGAVLVEGTGGGTGVSSPLNYGVLVTNSAVITNAGTGAGATVTVRGLGGNTTGAGNDNYGVQLRVGAQITSEGGPVLVEGTGGGSSTSGFNYGVYLETGGVITSNGPSAAATVTVTGTGGAAPSGSNVGVHVVGAASKITSSGGAVEVTGISPLNTDAIRLNSDGEASSGGNAHLTLIADSLNVVDAASTIRAGAAGNQTATIRPRTAGRLINLGGADNATQLGLTDAELNRIFAGTLVIGSAASGPITVSAAINPANANNVTLVTGHANGVTANAVVTVAATVHVDSALVNLNADIAAPTITGTATAIFVDDNPSGQIQDGIDIAAAGATVHVAAGTYIENIIVTKPLSIVGDGANVVTVLPSFVGVIPTGSGSLPAGHSSLMLVRAHNVTISDMTLDGNNPGLTSGILSNGVDVDARNGIISDHTFGTFNNLIVHDVVVQNIYLRGIQFSGGNGFHFHHNEVNNVAGESQSIAIFNFAGSGVIEWNEVSNSNDGIAANQSRGTQFLHNTVTQSGSGVHTDNNGGSGGVADEIKFNTVTNGSIPNGSYGIWVFATYHNVVVQDNDVFDVNVGIGVFGSFAPVTVQIVGNSVDLNGRAGSYGMWISTTLFGFGSANVSAAITGDNSITGAEYGVYVQKQSAPHTATALISGNAASIFGNEIGIVVDGASATITGNHIYDNGIGIQFSNGGNGSVTGNDFEGGASLDNETDLRLDSDAGAVTIGAGNLFAGDDYFIDNRSAQGYDLTSYTAANFEGLTNNFRIEDRMFHGPDLTGAGTISWVAGHLFVTTPNTGDSDETIQNAITAAAAGNTVNVEAGTFNEDVAVNKSLRVLGAGPGSSIVSGPIGGGGATFQVTANNVEIAGFTITRDGNNPTDWNNAGLNLAGVAINGPSLTGMLIHDNYIVGNRTGIDVNNTSGHTIRNNVIDNNRTGLIFRNQTNNITFTENQVSNNWTVGLLFLDASSGTNSPLQQALNSTFSNNAFYGNWYGQIVDRQAGGSLPAPGTNLKNFSGNWFGATALFVTTADSAEPGYAALIPVIFGGTATAPGGQPDIAGPASANFDFTPYLATGADTDVETTIGWGTFGFQGDFSSLVVTTEGGQTGSIGRVQEGVDAIADGAATGSDRTVYVFAGSYSGQVNISKSVSLLGTADINGDPATTLTVNLPGGGDLVTIQGNAFTGDQTVRLESIAFLGNGANNVDNGVVVHGSARLAELSVTNSTFSNFDTVGIAVFGDAGNAGISVENVVLTDLTLTNNGFQSIGGAGDINFFEYNGDATLTDLVLSNVGNAPPNSPRGGIQIRGVGANDGSGRLPMGNVAFDNVDISGRYRNYFITIQRYTDLANLSFNDVQLGSATSELFGGFGALLRFDGVGSGTIAAAPVFNLGNTHFRGLAGTTNAPYFIEFAPDNDYAFLRLDATGTIWEGTAANALTASQLFNAEDRILHYVDADHPVHGPTFGAFKGFAELVNGNAYVTATPDFTTGKAGVINRAIQAVDAGGTIHIHAGSYGIQNVSTAGKAANLSPGTSPGQVTIDGDLTLDGDDTLTIELNGANPLTQYDNFIVTGSVTLGGATLAASRGYVPAGLTVFTIIDGGALTPGFAGMPEGHVIALNGIPFTVSYVGGNATLTVDAPTTVYVDDLAGDYTITDDVAPGGLSAGDEVTWNGEPAVAGLIFGWNAFLSVQSAIDAVAASGTVNVAAGTYSASLASAGKTVSLIGANSGIDPNTDTRGPESIIQATDFWGVFFENSPGVVIDGFTVDGQGASDYGIYFYTTNGSGGASVRNNIVEGFTTYGFIGWVPSGAASSNNAIEHNQFDDIGGRAIVTLWNYYSDIRENVISQVEVGIYAENASGPEASGDVFWEQNTISARRAGIWYNLAYNSATPISIIGNVISAEDDNTLTRFSGIWITSIGGGLDPTISGNDITVGSIAQQSVGYDLWNNTTSASDGITISGGTVDGADYGVWVNNFDGYPTVTGSNGGSTTVTVSGVTIVNAALAGVYVKDNPSNTNSATVRANVINNTSISGSGTGVLVDGSDASAVISGNAASIFGNVVGINVVGGWATIHNNHVYNNTTGIRFTNGGGGSVTANNFEGGASPDNVTDLRFDADAGPIVGTTVSGNTFAGSTYYIDKRDAASLTALATANNYKKDNAAIETDNFRIEDRMFHGPDLAGVGTISWVAGHLFVTTPGTGASDETIQNAVTAAAAGNTVNVEAGTYVENVTIDKRLTLDGAGSGANPANNTVVIPPSTSLATFTITAGGLDAANRLVVRDIRAANHGGAPASNVSSGFLVSWTGGIGFMTFDNVAAVNNAGWGIGFNASAGTFQDLIVSNSVLSNNAIGLRIASSIADFDDVLIDNVTMADNTVNGFGFNPSGTTALGLAATNYTIQNSTFTNNGTGDTGSGDISFYGFNGNVTIQGTSITTDGHIGLQLRGVSTPSPAGTVLLQNLTFNGTPVLTSAPFIGYGLVVADYSTVGTITFDNVDVNITGSNTVGVLTFGIPAGQTLNLGDTAFGVTTGAYIDHDAAGAMNATEATFAGVTGGSATLAQNFAIEDKISHGVDAAGRGLVRVHAGHVYTTPNSFISPATSADIQHAVDAAASGDTVHIRSGAYTGDVSTAGKAIDLSPGSSPGQANIDGDLTLGGDDALIVELTGTAAALYDSLSVNGSVTLGGAQLALSLGFTPSLSHTFTLIDNDGSDPVSGHFFIGAVELVEGAVIVLSDGVTNFNYRISYVGGSGNDVVLSSGFPPQGANNTVSTFEDVPYSFAVADFGFSDPGDSPPDAFVAVVIASLPINGELRLNGTPVVLNQTVPVADIAAGDLQFVPSLDANGTAYASFTFQVQDDGPAGQNIDPTPKTMTIDVVSVNDAPAGADATAITSVDVPYVFAVGDFGFSDPADVPPNQFAGIVISTLPVHGTLVLAGVPIVSAGTFVTASAIALGDLEFVPAPLAVGTPYDAFQFQVRDDGGLVGPGAADTDPTPNTIEIHVVEPTTVDHVRIGDDTATRHQRSRIDQLTVTFSSVIDLNHPATIVGDAFTLTRLDDHSNVALTVAWQVHDNGTPMNPADDYSIATITFSPQANVFARSLIDGNYEFEIDGDALRDKNGARVDADGDGVLGGQTSLRFYRLFGDFVTTGEYTQPSQLLSWRVVENLDVGFFVAAYGSLFGTAAYDAAFDYDGDGDIDPFDSAFFVLNYGKSLPEV